MTAEETKQAIEAFEAAHPNHIEGRKVFPGYWRDVESLWIKAWEARGRADAQQVADGLAEIGKLIATQDNRATASPIFAVQQRRRTYGTDTDYSDNIVWLHSAGDSEEADAEENDRLETQWAENCEEPDGWTRTAYIDTWEFVTACFTEQGCKDYIARDGHNLKEPRIYAYGSYRNNEYQAVRKWLLSLASPQPVTPADQGSDGEKILANRYERMRQQCLRAGNLHPDSEAVCHQAVSKARGLDHLVYEMAMLLDDFAVSLLNAGK